MPEYRPELAYTPWDPRRAGGRILSSLAAGALTALLLRGVAEPSVAAVAAWDAAGLVMLSLSWAIIWQSDAEDTHCRAAKVDPGRRMAWGIVLLASSFSVFAAGVVMRKARDIAPSSPLLLAALCMGAVLIAWLLTHTAYALRYAHLYYRDDDGEGIGGLTFAGDEPPDAFDFAYFSFTIGMCFQVSDVVITSRQIRRAVLFHGCLSFAYNTTVLALALNIGFGLLGLSPAATGRGAGSLADDGREFFCMAFLLSARPACGGRRAPERGRHGRRRFEKIHEAWRLGVGHHRGRMAAVVRVAPGQVQRPAARLQVSRRAPPPGRRLSW